MFNASPLIALAAWGRLERNDERDRMTELRDTLRSLPSFPSELRTLTLDDTPDNPVELFRAWLNDAIEQGDRQPHAMTFMTVDDAGAPSARTLILKDIDDRGIHISSSVRTRKGAHLAQRRQAGMLFFWRELARQVEVTGTVEALADEESLADWRERPNYTGTDNPDWRVWALRPERMEFLQATHDRAHTRIEYLRDGDGWAKQQLRPSELPTP